MRHRSFARWHLDEVFISINGQRMYLWPAVDAEGEVLDILVERNHGRPSLQDNRPRHVEASMGMRSGAVSMCTAGFFRDCIFCAVSAAHYGRDDAEIPDAGIGIFVRNKRPADMAAFRPDREKARAVVGHDALDLDAEACVVGYCLLRGRQWRWPFSRPS
jgi:hypothetical protein